MNLTPLPITGSYLIESPCFSDARGAFHTAWEEGGQARELSFSLFGSYHSYNRQKGTLRGMHYQRSPHTQAKIVSCSRGSIFDVILDLRPNSETHLRWHSLELIEMQASLYVPHGCAHGFVSREDDTIVSYLIEGTYAPEHQATVRWDDPAFAIKWPSGDVILSERDRQAPDFRL